MERHDTQQARQARWEAVSCRFWSDAVIQRLWARAKKPDGRGTEFEGADPDWLMRVVVAGGVDAKGWAPGVPQTRKDRSDTATAREWLRQEGRKVQTRVHSTAWGTFLADIPAVCPMEAPGSGVPRVRLSKKSRPRVPLPPAPPPRAPPAPATPAAEAGPPPVAAPAPMAAPPRRRIRGKQSDTQQFPGGGGEARAADGYVTCRCGVRIKSVSMHQHERD